MTTNIPPAPSSGSGPRRTNPRAFRRLSGLVALCIVALGAAFIAGRSSAAGVPGDDPLTYSGSLYDDEGQPVSGKLDMLLQLWATPSGGTVPLCQSPATAVEVVGGQFDFQLPKECTELFRNSRNIWLELIVEGDSMGRSKTGVVPYALEAEHALQADQASLASGAADELAEQLDNLQARLDQLSCPEGYLRAGPNLCVQSGPLNPASGSWAAIETCSAQGAHVCSHNEMQQTCAVRGATGADIPADFNPYAGATAGWYSDHAADDTYFTWNSGACTANNDSPAVAAATEPAVLLPFRCCK